MTYIRSIIIKSPLFALHIQNINSTAPRNVWLQYIYNVWLYNRQSLVTAQWGLNAHIQYEELIQDMHV